MPYGDEETTILNRILMAVEKDAHSRWIETACTVLLSLATLTSAWCVYQSSQWNGEQFFRIEDYNGADRKRMQTEIRDTQRRGVESVMIANYVDALTGENKPFADILFSRFPSHLKNAVEAWQKTDPFNNPSAPRLPFDMSEYVSPEADVAAGFEKEATDFRHEADLADKNSDTYMLLSLLLAMVLFFSGLSGVTESYWNRRVLLGIAFVILLGVAAALFRMPVIL